MVITVFGLGFVGLTTAVGFSEIGIKVYGVDVNKERTAVIKRGELPFFEPGLDKALVKNINHTFFITENINQAIKESDCIYFCVGTPYGEGGQADLTYLYAAIDRTLDSINDDKFRVLVTKSTIPPSTTKEKIIPYIEKKGWGVGTQIGIANNPEFLREGYCWNDFMKADRIVLGVNDEHSERILRDLYSGFDIPLYAVSLNTSEFIKYLSNTFLATLISYSNEMSIAADAIGDIDVAEAFKILHMDKRWNGCGITNYIYPGCGYGGYCLPKDTNAFYYLVESKGFEAQILKNVIATNDHMPDFITARIEKSVTYDKCIGILGLSFKPESDDVRATPAAAIIQRLLDDGYKNISAYDPMAVKEFQKHYDINIEYCSTMQHIIDAADVLVILTAWKEFQNLPSKTEKTIIDCRYTL